MMRIIPRKPKVKEYCRVYDRIPSMKKKTIRVGFDFDGVIAYNPLRIFRLPTNILKNLFLHQRELRFYYPKTRLEQWIWILIHESSFFPAVGISELRTMLEKSEIEAYLITSRYACLEPSLFRWLKKHNLHQSFRGYFVNKKNEQPHLFKEKMIKSLELDAFIDDSWDIVQHLNQSKQANGLKTEIHWVYNMIDRFNSYPHKHPHLKAFIEEIQKRV